MKISRAPVIVDIMFSIEWFLLVAAAIIPFLYFAMDDPMTLCIKITLCSAAYVAAALAMRAERIPFLRIAVPLLAAAGCVLIGENTVERIILGAVGVMAAACGFVIYYKLRRDCQAYSGMMYFSAVLILMMIISGKLDMPQEVRNEAGRWLAVFSAVYLPLCVASVGINRLQDSLSIFKGRSEQPVTDIRNRVGRVILTSAGIVLLVMLVVPQNDGSSLLENIFFAVFYSFIAGLARVACAMPGELEKEPEAMEQILPPQMSCAGEQGVLGVVSVVILLALGLLAVIVLIRLVRNLVLGLLNRGQSDKQRFSAKYDTVEKIKETVREKGEKSESRSNAAKVRRIYRKRINSVLGRDKVLRNSMTPAEIVRLCSKKGVDVSALTALYNKARYTKVCTDEDVKAAQKL